MIRLRMIRFETVAFDVSIIVGLLMLGLFWGSVIAFTLANVIAIFGFSNRCRRASRNLDLRVLLEGVFS